MLLNTVLRNAPDSDYMRKTDTFVDYSLVDMLVDMLLIDITRACPIFADEPFVGYASQYFHLLLVWFSHLSDFLRILCLLSLVLNPRALSVGCTLSPPPSPIDFRIRGSADDAPFLFRRLQQDALLLLRELSFQVPRTAQRLATNRTLLLKCFEWMHAAVTGTDEVVSGSYREYQSGLSIVATGGMSPRATAASAAWAFGRP